VPCLRNALQEPRGVEAEVFLIGDDDVIDDVDPEQETAQGKTLRELQVEAAWSRIRGQVIVHDHDGRSA
jgi:hypothetical protein